jgi:signal transduction histidine kinase
MGTSASLADPPAKDRVDPGRLAEEQAALRRVATLVASGAQSGEVFSAVVQEVAQLMHLQMVGVYRYDMDGLMTVIATWSDRPHVLQPGTRWPLDGQSMVAQVQRTGRPARVVDYTGLRGELAAGARESGLNATAGVPIVVNGSVSGAVGISSQDALTDEGRLWGVLAVASKGEEPLPLETERRLAEFTELVAAAIANTENREELAELAEEQAALRRVATLIAEDAPPREVFAEVISGVGRLVGSDAAALIRFDTERTASAISSWSRSGPTLAVGFQYPVAPGMAAWLVNETHQPARIESYDGVSSIGAAIAREQGWRSSVAAPVIVEGRLWGMAIVYSKRAEPLPADTEERLAKFTRLIETSVANAESRAEIARLAAEQAALRRVATLVAQGATPTKVFETVAAEVGGLIPADAASLGRYETDGVTAVASWTKAGGYLPPGARRTLTKGTAAQLVFETQRPGRIDDYEGVPGATAATVRGWGWRSAVGAPVIVEGHLWGLILVASTSDRPLPPDTEERLAQFTELVATAIANTESRAELDASRARIVATADATRRQIERDLHDGAQQQLVSLALEVRAAQAAAPPELREHRAELSHVAEGLTSVLDRLREIALGIHPGILAEGGLGPALKTLAHRSPIPVTLEVRAEGRLPEPVEVAAYYVVSEALTNAAKHARASKVHVQVDVRGCSLRAAVRDDGDGGADPGRGSGLLGLKDRAEAIGGTIRVESPRGVGTTLVAELPLDHQRPLTHE